MGIGKRQMRCRLAIMANATLWINSQSTLGLNYKINVHNIYVNIIFSLNSIEVLKKNKNKKRNKRWLTKLRWEKKNKLKIKKGKTRFKNRDPFLVWPRRLQSKVRVYIKSCDSKRKENKNWRKKIVIIFVINKKESKDRNIVL